jgi:hypothetical protein
MWIKKGVIFNRQHAQLPTVFALPGNILRIFYSTKNAKGKSSIRYIEVDAEDPSIILNDPGHDVLKPGNRGCFDDSGVMPSCVIRNDNGQHWLYYTGWNTDKNDVPYGHGIGLAYWSGTDGEFVRIHEGPILDRCLQIPYLANSPFVMRSPQAESPRWTMWFCNGIGWDGDFPMYAICYASSEDGLYWQPQNISTCRSNGSAIGELGDAYSRPCVIHEGYDRIRIWTASKHKTNNYTLKSASSIAPWADWNRRWNFTDAKWTEGMKPSETGWDSEMICYPYVYRHGQRLYMFYNGNGYGETGIGWAEWN